MRLYYDEGDRPTEFTLPAGEMELNVADEILFIGGKHQDIIEFKSGTKLKSPDGSVWNITVDNSGALIAVRI